MSGGWAYTFSLVQAGTIELVFTWELVVDMNYESDEFGEMIVSLDGDERVIQRLTGDGNGGSDGTATGTANTEIWLNVGTGSHTVILGGYNNKKTFNDEFTRVRLDHVKITSQPSGPAPPTPAPVAATSCPNGPATYFPGGRSQTISRRRFSIRMQQCSTASI